VVVTADLISALEQRRIGGAALDVFDAAPGAGCPQALTNTVLTSARRRIVAGSPTAP
jgi:phosphoglycerate dehydrogenase-like enzyme